MPFAPGQIHDTFRAVDRRSSHDGVESDLLVRVRGEVLVRKRMWKLWIPRLAL